MTQIAEVKAKIAQLQEEIEAGSGAIRNSRNRLNELQGRLPHMTDPLEIATAELTMNQLWDTFPGMESRIARKRKEIESYEDTLRTLEFHRGNYTTLLQNSSAAIDSFAGVSRLEAIAEELKQLTPGIPGPLRGHLQDAGLKLMHVAAAYNVALRSKQQAEKALEKLGE